MSMVQTCHWNPPRKTPSFLWWAAKLIVIATHDTTLGMPERKQPKAAKNLGIWVESSNQMEVLSVFGWWKVWSYAMSTLSHVVQLPTTDSVALPSELNPQFHRAGRRTAAVEGKHLSDLDIIHSYSGLWGSSLHWAIITRHVGNTTLSLWWRPLCRQAMDMAKT